MLVDEKPVCLPVRLPFHLTLQPVSLFRETGFFLLQEAEARRQGNERQWLVQPYSHWKLTKPD